MAANGSGPIIDIRGVYKRFGAVEVLKGIDLAVAPRELVFLIGPSGAGKSTLLHLLAALDCPTGFASSSARHLGLNGNEAILLGRMSARIDHRPRPGDACVIAAWPTGREGRKLFADGALFGPGGELMAVSRTTWLLVDRAVQLGEKA